MQNLIPHYSRPRMVALLASFACITCVAIPLVAQDVIVMPPVLFDLPGNPNQPDTPPTLRKNWAPGYIEEMPITTEPGYAIYILTINEKGMCSNVLMAPSIFRPLSRDEMLARSKRPRVVDSSKQQCTPARKNGVPVKCFLWFAAIHNPASASKKNADATPRVLKVAPILVTKKQWDAFPKTSHVVRGSLEIDTAGAAKNLKLESDASFAQNVRAAIERSLAKWQFAPARKNGEPVNATLTLGFLVTPSPAEDERLQRSPATKRAR